MPKIEMDIQCQSCGGTGVYVGIAEHDGAAVVCHTCNGTGKYHYKFEYEEFSGLKERDGVSRVYKKNYGYVLAPREINFDKIGPVDLAAEGVSYSEFLSGKMPGHIKKMGCPMVADQSACHQINGFTDECDRLHGGTLLGYYLKNCNYYSNRAECWERFLTALSGKRLIPNKYLANQRNQI